MVEKLQKYVKRDRKNNDESNYAKFTLMKIKIAT